MVKLIGFVDPFTAGRDSKGQFLRQFSSVKAVPIGDGIELLPDTGAETEDEIIARIDAELRLDRIERALIVRR